MSWRPSLDAWVDETGARFRVWAPDTASVRVVVELACTLQRPGAALWLAVPASEAT